MLVYQSTQWVAYMNNSVKMTRTSYLEGLKMAGTSDWAIDLQKAVNGESDYPEVYTAPDSWSTPNPEVMCNPL